MKKEIIYWFSCIIASVMLMDALLYFGYQVAIYLSVFVLVACSMFYNKGLQAPGFSGLLSGSSSVGLFFLMILVIPLLINTHVGNIFASTCAILSMIFAFLSLAVDDKNIEAARRQVLESSLSGYTEGDYRFPTNEELQALR